MRHNGSVVVRVLDCSLRAAQEALPLESPLGPGCQSPLSESPRSVSQQQRESWFSRILSRTMQAAERAMLHPRIRLPGCRSLMIRTCLQLCRPIWWTQKLGVTL